VTAPDSQQPDAPRPSPAEAVTWQVRAAAAWTWRLLVIGLGIYVFARVLKRVELVAFSLAVALFLTAVLHPLEKRLRRLPGPKSLSAALALLAGIATLGGIGWFVVWQITEHSTELGDQVTNFVNQTKHWLQTGPLHLKSADLDKLTSQITDTIKSHQSQIISGAIKTVRTVVEGLGAVLLILLSTFFLLRDGDMIWRWVVTLFPRTAHERLDRAGHAGWGAFGGYMRGQLLIALFHGISVSIVLLVLRVPLAAALGVLIFLGSFIPLIGLTIAGALCVAVAGLEHGATAAIAVAVAIIVLFQLEAHLLQPVIMSRSVELHPLAIALVVITGTLLAGIAGALVAVPLAAFLNTTIRALREPLPAVAATGPPGAEAGGVSSNEGSKGAETADDRPDVEASSNDSGSPKADDASNGGSP
jgi:predicted PurR-regulated permease PerM